jgi:hypothetical protein
VDFFGDIPRLSIQMIVSRLTTAFSGTRKLEAAHLAAFFHRHAALQRQTRREGCRMIGKAKLDTTLIWGGLAVIAIAFVFLIVLLT